MSTVIDALQRPVDLHGRPRRIVSLVPSLTEALFAFGLGDAVAGVTRFCVEPRQGVAGKPRVGGTKTVEVGRVLALRPDLVVANVEENRREQIEALIGAGLRVFVTFPRTVAGAIETMRDLAALAAAGEAAAPVIQSAQEAVAETQAAVAGRRPLRVFCPIWRSPLRGTPGVAWMTIGADTYIHDFIRICGGRNIFGDARERYPGVVLEEMAARDPEVVLLPDEPYRFSADHFPEIEHHRTVSAVRNNRIHLLDGKHLCWYGPRIADSLWYVRRLLWGD